MITFEQHYIHIYVYINSDSLEPSQYMYERSRVCNNLVLLSVLSISIYWPNYTEDARIIICTLTSPVNAMYLSMWNYRFLSFKGKNVWWLFCEFPLLFCIYFNTSTEADQINCEKSYTFHFTPWQKKVHTENQLFRKEKL